MCYFTVRNTVLSFVVELLVYKNLRLNSIKINNFFKKLNDSAKNTAFHTENVIQVVYTVVNKEYNPKTKRNNYKYEYINNNKFQIQLY